MQAPSIGRIVHYVLQSGEHRPAIVVPTNQTPDHDLQVNLQVFLDGPNDSTATNPHVAPALQTWPSTEWRQNIGYSDPAVATCSTWHWPEQV